MKINYNYEPNTTKSMDVFKSALKNNMLIYLYDLDTAAKIFSSFLLKFDLIIT